MNLEGLVANGVGAGGQTRVKLPDGRTITVNTSDPQAAAKAARLLLAREAIVKSGVGAGRKQNALDQSVNSAVSGLTLGGSDVAGGAVSALATGAKNLALRAQGKQPTYGMADAYAAERELQKEQASAHPVATGVGGLFGALANPVNTAAATVVSKGVPALAANAPKVAKGLLAGTSLPAQAVRGAVVGAPLGAITGATGADPGQELAGAKSGALTGAAIGAGAPLATGAAAKGVQGVKGAAKVVARAANKAAGGKLLDSGQTAAQRLTEALKADGATPEQLRTALNDWLKNGATSPSLIDLASSLPSGGAKTLGLVRGAAMTAGPARGAAAAYAEHTEGALPSRGITLAKGLTPNKAPAATVEADLKAARGAMANDQYPASYGQPVDTAPVLDAVSGATGRKAISNAASLADAGRLQPELQELSAIRDAANPPPAPPLPAGTENLGPAAQAQVRAQLGLNGDAPIPPNVRLGTLDQVKRSLFTMADDAERGGDTTRAMFLRQRAHEIDQHLAENSADYGIARDNYAAGSRRLEGVELGRQGMTMPMDDYGAALDELIGKVRGEGPSVAPMDAGVGYRQAIVDNLAHQPAGAVGSLKRLGTAPDQTANLAKTFGEEAGGDFQAQVNQLRKQMANARFVDATQGSKTASASLDADLADVAPPSLPKGPVGALYMLANKVRQGATLTDAERGAIVNMGLAHPDEFMAQWHYDPQPIIERMMASGAFLAPAASEQTARAAQ